MIALAPPKRRLLAAGRIRRRREPRWHVALQLLATVAVWGLAMVGAWCLLKPS